MGARTVRTVVAAAVVVMALAGCRSVEKEKAAPTGGSVSGGTSATPSPSATVKNYTAKQLAKALITPPAGAAAIRRASGSYADVLAKQSEGAPKDGASGDSACRALSKADMKQFQKVPSAFVDFAQLERSTSVQLLAAPGGLDRQAALTPIPKECRSAKARIGGTTFTSKVVTDEPFDLADGGRIRRTDEVSGGMKLHSWDVTFVGPGYVATCAVFGTHVTRADAERLARQEYSKAKATLR
jgi:hypothetical protein